MSAWKFEPPTCISAFGGEGDTKCERILIFKHAARVLGVSNDLVTIQVAIGRH
jgi:hypothetical protein